MASLANRAALIGLFRQPLNLIRSFSASTTPCPPDGKLNLKKKKKNLFQVVQFLPDCGIGHQMAKTHWTGDGRHGEFSTKTGMPAADAPKKKSVVCISVVGGTFQARQ